MSSPRWRLLQRHRPPARRHSSSANRVTRAGLGQSVVELALILPIFLILIAVAVDLGRLFYAYVAIVNASKEGALFGAQYPQCDTSAACDNPQNVVWHVQNEAGNLVDSTGAPLVPLISCMSGSVKLNLSDCADGATYRVTVNYKFRLITPILGSLLDKSLTLSSQSEATVLNPVVDPKPGISVRKLVWNPDTKNWERTPVPDPKTGKLKPIQFYAGETVKYRILIQNSGGVPVTGLTLTDVPDGKPSCALTLPYDCPYERVLKDSDLDGAESRLLTDTVTVSGLGISQVQDVAIIEVLARPPELRVSKNVNVYRQASPFGNETTLKVSENSLVHPTVWYRILVKNVGGRTATNLSITDSMGHLPRNPDCPKLPDSLDPNDSYFCFYSRTFTGPRTVDNTVSVDSRETSPVTADATVDIDSCSAPRKVVPNLVEDGNGDSRTVGDARNLWTDAEFTGQFSPATGSDGRDVLTQDEDPFGCKPASTDVKVTHK